MGMRRGIPVGMGYFSVSFGFGALAAAQGLRPLEATLISLTNLTSAGQFAGLTLILTSAGLWEMILTQLVINSRYALMSLALSQKMGQKIGLLPRFLIAFFNTDEIFALAMSRQEPLTTPYLLGLGILPILGWTLGTLAGALAGRPSWVYYPDGLKKLKAHDESSQVSYLETLRVYLDNNLSVTKTAAALYLHRSTLLDRLAHITQMLGCDLKNPDFCLTLGILLRAELQQKRITQPKP